MHSNGPPHSLLCALTCLALATPAAAIAQTAPLDASQEGGSPPPAPDSASSDSTGPGEVSAPSRALARPVHLGLGTHGGIVDGADGLEGFFDWGLTASATIFPHLTLGLTRVGFGAGYSSIEGSIWLVDFTPFVEGWLFATVALQFYSRLGLTMQIAGETNLRDGSFEASVYFSAGARWWLLEWLSLELELAAFAPISESMVFGGARIEPFSVVGTLGGGVGFHF